MTEADHDPRVRIGYASETGARRNNEDFVGAVIGDPGERRDVVAAIADGVGGASGGRIAAETAVRGFLDGFWEAPETVEVRWAAAKVLDALNRWIHAQGQQDEGLAGMGCTFTGLVLRRRICHLVHVGDSRAYRFSGDRLTQLTTDHVRDAPRGALLYRALGVEAELRLDYAQHPIALHDRFLLCTDGVHRVLADQAIGDILRTRQGPAETSRRLVDTALAAGGDDNCTALVLDVVGLPDARSRELDDEITALPVLGAPRLGETIDGFELKALISEGPLTRLIAAIDHIEGGEVALKFPKPALASVAAHHAAFVREAWVGARLRSPWVGRVIELPPGRQSQLYTAMPLYRGELLETRLTRRPLLGLEEGRNVAVKLAHAAAALHRAGVIHRDIKPDNIILEAGGSLKLIDLGVVRIPALEETSPSEIPGTAAYMAPEMFDGEAGNVATDVYALGVTLFRAFAGEFPYGETDATSRQRAARPKDLSDLRPDLPSWLGAAVARAIATKPQERFEDMIELADELEAGPSFSEAQPHSTPTFYERHRLAVWQSISGVLAAALAASLWLR